jgi:hypothetical protein
MILTHVKAKKTASLVLANTLVEIQDRIEEIKTVT